MNGYTVVDCKGMNLLAQSKQTIPGLYAQCEAADFTNKIIIAANCQYGAGVEMSPIAVMAIKEDGKYCFTSSILQIWVDSEDGVEIVSLLS